MSAVEATEQVASQADVFELVYQGPEVENGTMSSRELIEVLTGLSRAFVTISYERGIDDKYDLRVKDINHNSFHLLLEAIAFAQANPAPATAIVAGAALALNATTNVISGAYKVISDIGVMLEAKKRAKGERIGKVPVQFIEGGVQLEASGGAIVLTREQYDLLLSQRIDRQLAQIVSPLSVRRIEYFHMRRSDVELVRISAEQRDYFDYFEATEDHNREGTEIVGTLNSLTKTSLRGTFHTMDGVHVPYRYTGGDIAQLMRGFAAREPLRVRGKIKYDADGTPVSVDVQQIEFVQRSFTDQ